MLYHPRARNLGIVSAPLCLSQTRKPHGFSLGNAFWVSLPVLLWPQTAPVSNLSSCLLTHSSSLHLLQTPSSHRPDLGDILPKLPEEFLFSTDYYSVFLAWLPQTSCTHFTLLTRHQATEAEQSMGHFTKSMVILYFSWDVFISFFCLSSHNLLLFHLNKN